MAAELKRAQTHDQEIKQKSFKKPYQKLKYKYWQCSHTYGN